MLFFAGRRNRWNLASKAALSPTLWRPATTKRVVLNMATQPETTPLIFHSLNCDMAFDHDSGIQAESIRNNYLASETFARFE
jgi:hypothetical protein